MEPGDVIYTPISEVNAPGLRGFLDHWRTLPKTDGFPSHADLDLRVIKRGLPHVHAYDILSSNFRSWFDTSTLLSITTNGFYHDRSP